MAIAVREAAPEEREAMIPLLLLAEPSERALRWSFEHLSDAVYRMEDDGALVAAATMLWRREPCEIIELAVDPSHQRQGHGRRFLDWLVDEARARGHKRIVVGTSSTSADNLLFYQRCGFRVEAVRRDYFWYYDEPVLENGLPVRDMIVFERTI